MVELAGERGLVEEQLLEALGFLLAHLRIGLRELDRDLSVVERVLGEVDVGRRALPKLRQDAVLADLVGTLRHARYLPEGLVFQEVYPIAARPGCFSAAAARASARATGIRRG